ncbi:MAG: acylphosphatase [Acidimicrobiia bacterium]|nr:acylphosphatase [Acidimicrobiia bacterium]
MSELNSTLLIQVSGRVQGVGFRYSTLIQARSLNITGWVRNREDGSVEVLGQGSDDALEVFTRFLTVGPPGAKVTSISVRRDAHTVDAESFEIR